MQSEIEHLSRLSGRLEHDSDGAFLAVVVRDGERHALAVLVKAEDNKLARFALSRHQRRLDHHLGGRSGGVKDTLF